MTVRTLIVDDESLARDRLRQLLQTRPEIQIVGEAADGLEAVRVIREQKPDLLFLDIQMPEMDGFDVLGSIDTTPPPAVVFVTAHDQFALKAFEVHAVDYLLKPFDRERFDAALQHALEQVKNRTETAEKQKSLLSTVRPPASTPLDRLAVKSGGHIVWVTLDEIDWIESADNYVELHTGAKSHLLRETLNALETRLPPDRFVRISRSAMVNARKVKELQRMLYGGYQITLQNGNRLTMSRRFKDRLGQLGVE